MTNILQLYGWQHYCQKHANDLPEENIGRIKSVNKTNYEVVTSSGIVLGEVTGQLLYASNKEALPHTGDWVQIMCYENSCIITRVLDRYSELGRKEAGRKTDRQLIATNIDKAFIVQGLDQDYNPRRLERMTAVLNDAGIASIILLNKADLTSDAPDKIREIEQNLPNTPVLLISALLDEGIDSIKNHLAAEHTYIMIGSSGAGKSTLLNSLMGQQLQKTSTISNAVGKGRHTTTNRELFVLPNGSLMIDTAGVREFGLAMNETQAVELTFTDIQQLAKQCRFQDCTHIDEPDCAVLKALESGQLQESLYESYLKLRKEAEHYSATQQDKKRKGKDLSRLVRDMKRQNMKKRY